MDAGGLGLDKLAPALVALQADLKPVEKSADNPFFKSKYAPLPEVMKAVQPLLATHKLAITQFPTSIDGTSALRTILLHESGQFLEDVTPLLLVKNDPQAQGSAQTYARRYGVMSVLGLVADDDDDGNAASAPSKSQPAEPSKPRASTTNKPSEKQINLIAILSEQKGKDDEWLKLAMSKIHSSADASALIDKLNELEDA